MQTHIATIDRSYSRLVRAPRRIAVTLLAFIVEEQRHIMGEYPGQELAVPARGQPREEVELTVRATSGSRIQDGFDLLGITRLWLHHQPQALQLRSTHQISSKGHAAKQAMIALITRFVSSGPLTGIESTRAFSAG